jgi:hypothetical protein
MHYVGKLGIAAATAGVGMGNLFINVFSLSIIMGMNTAI